MFWRSKMFCVLLLFFLQSCRGCWFHCVDVETLKNFIKSSVKVTENEIHIGTCCDSKLCNWNILWNVSANRNTLWTGQCECCKEYSSDIQCGRSQYINEQQMPRCTKLSVEATITKYPDDEAPICKEVYVLSSLVIPSGGFNLPKTEGLNLIVTTTQHSVTAQISGVTCVGESTTLLLTAVDQLHTAHMGEPIEFICGVGDLQPVSVSVDGLEPETFFSLEIHASANCGGESATESSQVTGVTSTLAYVPSISAYLANVTSRSVVVGWNISNTSNCVSKFVIFLLSYSTYNVPPTNITSNLSQAACSTMQSLIKEIPLLLPYRTFNVIASTCNSHDQCGTIISIFTGKTLPEGEAKPISAAELNVTVFSDNVSIMWEYLAGNCGGPTTFMALARCEGQKCTFTSSNKSFGDCPESAVPVTLLFNSLYHDTMYEMQLMGIVDGISGNTPLANFTHQTGIANSRIPVEVNFLQLLSNSARIYWDFDIQRDCVSNNILYAATIKDQRYSPIHSSYNLSNCISFPNTQFQLDFSNLHLYRNYTNFTLTSCNSIDQCKTASYDNVAIETPIGEPLRIASDSMLLEFDEKTKLIHAYANYTYDDCMGPTSFDFTLKLLIGSELDLSFEPISIPQFHPNCPIAVDNVNATLRDWHAYRTYQLSVTLSTGVGSAQTTTNTFDTESTEAQTLTSNATIKSISSSEIEISLLFNNDDCYGPTSFKIDYVSSNGESGSTTVQSSNYPFCPRFLIPSVETFLIQKVQQNVIYKFSITPYTDKGTVAKPLLVEYKVPIETSGTSWYVIAVPIFVAVMVVAIVIFGVVKYRTRNKLQDIPIPNTIHSNFYRRPIKVSDYAVFYKRLTKTWQLRLRLEYQRLALISPKLNDSRKTPVAMLVHNRMKNRFPDVLPFDYNRVRLGHEYINFRQTQSSSNTFTTDDYINASFIENWKKHVEYIAAMGPISVEETTTSDKVETVADFLQMILEQNVKVVVMLTMPEEQNQNTTKIKSAKYWPSNVGQSVKFSDYTVELIEEKFPTSDYDIRTLNVSKNGTNEPVLLHHFLYKDMLDYGVTKADKMLNFVRKVQSVSVENPSNPIVIHCSAGAGRTGTFIAIDQLLQQLSANVEVLDVFNVVYNLRKQRVKMVQTQAQYRLVYDTVALAIQQLEGSDHTYENVPETDAYENA